MAVGALAVSASAILIDLSRTSPGTASTYRCALSLPILILLARTEGQSAVPASTRLIRVLAGVLFAGDMLLWAQAIVEVGAGLSTVLVNAQVVIVPLLALVIDHERAGRRYVIALPFLVVGVVLTGGVLESGVRGSDPTLGTVHAVLAALCYSGFLFLLRRGGHGGQIQSYRDVVATAAAVSLVAGAFWHGVNPTPGWASVDWLALVALCGQIMGWLLVALSSPRLSSSVGAALLLLTPAGALVLGALAPGERPTMLQLVGCAVMLAAAYAASSER